MFGVVLWSDDKDGKAVIWCEDHRNLAFYKQESACEAEETFAPGDLVEFDLREENNLRLAVDPSLVAPHEFPAIAHDLKSASAGLRKKIRLPAEPVTPDRRVLRLRPRGPAASAQLPRICLTS